MYIGSLRETAWDNSGDPNKLKQPSSFCWDRKLHGICTIYPVLLQITVDLNCTCTIFEAGTLVELSRPHRFRCHPKA